MQDLVEYALNKGSAFCEIKSVKAARNTISCANRKITELSSGTNEGYGCRVIFKGKIGNSFSAKLENVLIDDAIKNAEMTDQQSSIDIRKPIRRKFITRFKINPEDISLEQKKKDLLSIKKTKETHSLTLSYSDVNKKTEYANSEGSALSFDDTMIHMSSVSLSKKHDRIESYYETVGGHTGYEIFGSFEEKAEEAMKKSNELLGAKQIKAGTFPAVIDPILGGVFAHECIGHASEADLIMSNSSVLKDKIGKAIGPEFLDIIDDGSLDRWGWCPFDSEGILGARTGIVEKGELKTYLHTRVSAREFGVQPTGNGRQQTFDSKIIPRMTNTYIGPGNSTQEEIFRSVQEGYYLISSAGGQVEPSSGEFLFNAMEAFKITNGELGERVKGASLSGDILASLHDIKLVDKKLDFGVGFCGKSGQYVPVGTGGPHFKFDKVMIGGHN
jgi:TldD protein